MLVEVSQLPGDYLRWILHMADLINKPKKVQLKSVLLGKYISQNGQKKIQQSIPETSNCWIINQLLMETLQLLRITITGRLTTIEFHLAWMHLKWVASRSLFQKRSSHMENQIDLKPQLKLSLTITSVKMPVTPSRADIITSKASRNITPLNVTTLKSDTPTQRKRQRSLSKPKMHSTGLTHKRISSSNGSKT